MSNISHVNKRVIHVIHTLQSRVMLNLYKQKIIIRRYSIAEKIVIEREKLRLFERKKIFAYNVEWVYSWLLLLKYLNYLIGMSFYANYFLWTGAYPEIFRGRFFPKILEGGLYPNHLKTRVCMWILKCLLNFILFRILRKFVDIFNKKSFSV